MIIPSLCQAGIPIIAIGGAAGGYEISDRFVMDRGFATIDDYSYIQTALRGLVSATEDQKAKNVLEKFSHASDSGENGMILDFSALQEIDRELLRTLQTAALEKRTVEFTYTNNMSRCTVRSDTSKCLASLAADVLP